jgi:hypothetical protein
MLARQLGISQSTLYRRRPLGIMKSVKQGLQTFDPTAPTESQPAKAKTKWFLDRDPNDNDGD